MEPMEAALALFELLKPGEASNYKQTTKKYSVN